MARLYGRPSVWGITQTMMYGDGYGLSRPDLYVTSLIDKLHGWTARANELSETAEADYHTWRLHRNITVAITTAKPSM